MIETIFKPDNTIGLWAVLTSIAAISIVLEQKFKWASKITGCVIAMTIAALMSNFKVIPTDSPVYDNVWAYLVPIAIPLLLFKADIKKIWKESGRLLVIFLLSALGTIVGSLLGFYILQSYIPDLFRVAAMMAGSYIGGSVNFAAMAESFNVPGDLVSAAVVSDNLIMAVYFFVLIAMPSMYIIKKLFKLENEKTDDNKSSKSLAADYWKPKEISMKDLALSIALAISIVFISGIIADYFASVISGDGLLLSIIKGLLGNKYLILTTLTMLLATYFSKFFGKIGGAQEIGSFIIHIFFVVIGIPASISLIMEKSPLLLVYCAIMVFVNMIFTIGFGRLFKFKIEEVIMASNANIGGPTTAAAMAIAKGWHSMVVPVMLVGSLGYILGNYCGIFIGNLLINY